MDFISKIAIFMLMLESTCSIDIVDDYKLNLTSSGPAVRGSFINFQAQLYLGASKTPTKDEELFRYDWRDSVYLLTESQHANFNTSYKPCFDSLVEPRTYSMRVSVYDAKKKSIFVPVTRKDIDFTITSTLNGNLKHNQTVHRGLRAANNTFSTGKPVHFTANLTDIFILPPTFTYKWLKDGEEYTASNVNNISLTFEKTGKHVVRLDVVSTGIPVDCRGDEYLDSLKGSFKTEIILKDPVQEFKLDGKTNITQDEDLKLNVSFNGSPPYTFCWKLKLAHHSKELERECYNETDKSTFKITVPKRKFSITGKYFLSVYVENDVSVVSKNHVVSVNNVPVPPSSHSAAYVLVPVISALVVVSLLVIGGVYYVNLRRRRGTHIEAADFQFHSSIQQTTNDGWFLTNVKDIFRTAFSSPDNDKIIVRDERRSSKNNRGYGTMENIA